MLSQHERAAGYGSDSDSDSDGPAAQPPSAAVMPPNKSHSVLRAPAANGTHPAESTRPDGGIRAVLQKLTGHANGPVPNAAALARQEDAVCPVAAASDATERACEADAPALAMACEAATPGVKAPPLPGQQLAPGDVNGTAAAAEARLHAVPSQGVVLGRVAANLPADGGVTNGLEAAKQQQQRPSHDPEPAGSAAESLSEKSSSSSESSASESESSTSSSSTSSSSSSSSSSSESESFSPDTSRGAEADGSPEAESFQTPADACVPQTSAQLSVAQAAAIPAAQPTPVTTPALPGQAADGPPEMAQPPSQQPACPVDADAAQADAPCSKAAASVSADLPVVQPKTALLSLRWPAVQAASLRDAKPGGIKETGSRVSRSKTPAPRPASAKDGGQTDDRRSWERRVAERRDRTPERRRSTVDRDPQRKRRTRSHSRSRSRSRTRRRVRHRSPSEDRLRTDRGGSRHCGDRGGDRDAVEPRRHGSRERRDRDDSRKDSRRDQSRERLRRTDSGRREIRDQRSQERAERRERESGKDPRADAHPRSAGHTSRRSTEPASRPSTLQQQTDTAVELGRGASGSAAGIEAPSGQRADGESGHVTAEGVHVVPCLQQFNA